MKLGGAGKCGVCGRTVDNVAFHESRCGRNVMTTNEAARRLVEAIRASQMGEPDVVPTGWFTVQQIAEMLGKKESCTKKQMAKCRNLERRKFRVRVGKFVRPTYHYRLK